MKALRQMLDKAAPLFHKGGKLERYYPVFEFLDTLMFTPSRTTTGKTHLRDGIDLKRVMITVVYALIPATLFALYNTGLQANLAHLQTGIQEAGNWQEQLYLMLGLEFNPENILANVVLGFLYFMPIYFITLAVGGVAELLFSVIRKHEISEGFLVTSLLFPLIVPPTLPLWQAAVAITFGVIIGKEVFGGVGYNILNPALTARVFLFFAYPGQISGDKVWVALDGHSSATGLAEAAVGGQNAVQNFIPAGLENIFGDLSAWWAAFLGFIPGSMGETSTLAVLIGAIILIATGIGSWRIMLAVLIGMAGTSGLLNLLNTMGWTDNPMFSVLPHWHFVLGSFAFATVFMATDPVSASQTRQGQWYYGLLIGFMGILVRCANPAYPEGWMLAILFGNVFSPIIDYFVMKTNIKRRQVRNA